MSATAHRPARRELRAPRWAACALAIVASACGTGAASSPVSAPDVVVVVLDTVRADHLGCYGYARDTTPRIDAFARGATLYRRAFATAPWTLPSHASLFTGLSPFEHGVHARPPDSTETSVRALAPEQATLAELLRDAGYRTGGFVANALLNPALGLDRGFDTWHYERAVAEQLNREVFRWLDEDDRRPFFLFVNYMDAHRVYNTEGRRSFLLPPDPADRGEPLERLTRLVLPGTSEPPSDLVARVVGEYDTAIASLDDAVGDLFGKLRTLRRFDNAVVVVTSDHGEAFGEHALVEHGRDVYQEELAVPLLMKSPGQTHGDQVAAAISLEEVPRRISERLPPGLATRIAHRLPPPRAGGTVLAEKLLVRTRDRNSREWGHRFRRERRVLVGWPFKLVASSDGHDELFDLDADPFELENLLAQRAEDAARLRSALLAALAAPRRSSSVEEPLEPDAELRRQLEALGYL